MLALLAAVASCVWAAGPLDLPDKPFSADVKEISRGAAGAEYLVRFPSALKSPFAANDMVWAHFLLPAGKGPFPTVLVLPVMAAPNVWIEERFIKRFVADGMAVLWLEMPYQFHRRPDPLIPSGQVFLARTAARLAFNFRQSALDARRALGWLSRQGSVDAGRVGIFGVSLGALVGSAVYSVDSRPRYAVFLLGGADFPSLAVASSMTGPFLSKMGIAPERLRAAWKGLDPLDYAAANRDKPALLINARSDSVVPFSSAAKLKEAFPSAQQLWVPFGHYTAMIHLLWVPGYVSRQFSRVFGKTAVKNAASP